MKHAVVALSLIFSGCAGGPEVSGSTESETAPRALTVLGSEITYSDATGESCENAVVIRGAPDQQTGVRSQYAWLTEVYPGAELVNRGSSSNEEQTAFFSWFRLKFEGESIYHCFDITEYFVESMKRWEQ